jgi:hypothetical protein
MELEAAEFGFLRQLQLQHASPSPISNTKMALPAATLARNQTKTKQNRYPGSDLDLDLEVQTLRDVPLLAVESLFLCLGKIFLGDTHTSFSQC